MYFPLATECCAHGWFSLVGSSTVSYCLCLDTVPLRVVQPLAFLFLISCLEEKHKAPMKSSTGSLLKRKLSSRDGRWFPLTGIDSEVE